MANVFVVHVLQSFKNLSNVVGNLVLSQLPLLENKVQERSTAAEVGDKGEWVRCCGKCVPQLDKLFMWAQLVHDIQFGHHELFHLTHAMHHLGSITFASSSLHCMVRYALRSSAHLVTQIVKLLDWFVLGLYCFVVSVWVLLIRNFSFCVWQLQNKMKSKWIKCENIPLTWTYAAVVLEPAMLVTVHE